jgi:hypothetical protein
MHADGLDHGLAWRGFAEFRDDAPAGLTAICRRQDRHAPGGCNRAQTRPYSCYPQFATTLPWIAAVDLPAMKSRAKFFFHTAGESHLRS